MDHEKSPAVQSLESEQARQRESGAEAELEEGLKDSFPASHPLSITNTTTSTPSLERRGDADAPSVDDALQATGDREGTSASLDPGEELRALQVELSRLRDVIAEIGSSSLRIARSRADESLEHARKTIRQEPVVAVAIAALLGFVWGRTR